MSRPGEGPEEVAAEFRRRYRTEPEFLVRAPGRVNLIGEHTDYNDGFVLPMAIDREVRIALRARGDGVVRVNSLDLGSEAEFDTLTLERGRGWGEYLKGVAWSLMREGLRLGGFDGTLGGDVPRGSGLSSSAALELAAARAFWAVSHFDWQPAAVARACQRAENEWLGVATGIMDQLVGAAGSRGNALLIDCRSLDCETVPLPAGTAVLVLDTGTRRGLVGSSYNERREQCEAAARRMGAGSLREVSADRFEAEASRLEPLLRRRARHVVSENGRTLRAAAAMRRGDAQALGRLMDQSHYSLRDDFDVSSPALDAIAGCAREHDGCFGARLTGAGFAGCAVALVAEESAAELSERVSTCYRNMTGMTAQVYLCRAADGAGDLPTI